MFAAVDLGSNSFRLHIGRHQNGLMKVLKSARDPIGLAAGLDADNVLSQSAIDTGIASLQKLAVILQEYKLDGVRVVATNTIRVAQNRMQFLPLFEQAIGYPVEIISGEEEGRLIYLGVAHTLNDQASRLVVDIGGGSTEMIVGQGYEIQRVESFSIGTTTPTRNFFPEGRITSAGYDAAILSARSTFEDAAPDFNGSNWSEVYGSSGTLRALAEALEKNRIGDMTLSYVNLQQLKTIFIAAGHVQNIDMAGIKTARVAVVVGGLAVVLGLMQQFNLAAMSPIEAGLRIGVLWDLQIQGTTSDRREQAVIITMQRFKVDQVRARYVAKVAAALFDMQKPAAHSSKSTPPMRQYVAWAAMLHETGLLVSQSGYHKHGAYLIANADIPGFNAREQKLMSQLILGQKGNLRKLGDALQENSNGDLGKGLLAIRMAVMFLHSRADIAGGVLSIRYKSGIDISLRKGLMAMHPTAEYWLNKEIDWWRQIGVMLTIKEA